MTKEKIILIIIDGWVNVLFRTFSIPDEHPLIPRLKKTTPSKEDRIHNAIWVACTIIMGVVIAAQIYLDRDQVSAQISRLFSDLFLVRKLISVIAQVISIGCFVYTIGFITAAVETNKVPVEDLPWSLKIILTVMPLVVILGGGALFWGLYTKSVGMAWVFAVVTTSMVNTGLWWFLFRYLPEKNNG